MFKKILIANRGEIACRVIKTAKKMGIGTVAVYSDADRAARHVEMADEAVHIGAPPATESYINIPRVMAAIAETGAEAVHPGYGFLSERAEFAEALAAAGVAFIGPPKGAIEAMGDKITSKKIAAEAGVSTVPGHMGLIEDADEAIRIAEEIGYPVMIKASAGGGGKGMRIAWDADGVREGFQSSKNEAAASFGDDRIFIEKFVTTPRHIEIQVLADQHGNCIHLGERECSIQRRNQKVVEEAPSPFLTPETRAAMGAEAVALAQAVGYASAGTVEFIVDAERNFYFLEMNTRLQVEHPVTELVTGLDLVEEMIRVAAGEPLRLTQDDVTMTGWAVESRLYAEDPYRNFLPSIGRLTRYRPPEETAAYAPGTAPGDAGNPVVRNDTGVYEGGEISRFYDPMIAKLCTWAADRPAAIDAMRHALDVFEVEGIGHNIPFLQAVMAHPRYVTGDISTAFIAEEYPDGFLGVTHEPEVEEYLTVAAVGIDALLGARAAAISGRMRPPEAAAAFDCVAEVNGTARPVSVTVAPDIGTAGGLPSVVLTASVDGSAQYPLEIRWRPGTVVAEIWSRPSEAAREQVLIARPRLHPLTEGLAINYRGADYEVIVRSPRRAELAALMPEKVVPDTSKMLLCPMPGLVVSIAVEEGQAVEDGQVLCTVEAMKMENVLRADRAGVVKTINAAPGASLAVDAVIMEFE